MEPEPRKEISIRGRTRREVCDKLALDFMERQAPALAHHMSVLLAQERKIQDALITMYAKGHLDGFSIALDLVLSGTINLQEININNPEQEQEQSDG